jgi:hypothetical protein
MLDCGIMETAAATDGISSSDFQSNGPEPASQLAGIHPNHLEDIRKSGLSDAMIVAMGIRSLTGVEIHRQIYHGEEPESSSWRGASGYAIPYYSSAGDTLTTRFRMTYDAATDEASSKPRYLSPVGAETHLYEPPGLDALLEAPGTSGYLIVTEGEKKAAKAVQEGFPCVALPGVAMWANSKSRAIDKQNGKKMNYASPVLDRLRELSDVKGRKVVILFDSDAHQKPQVNSMRWQLLYALLFQAAYWCRILEMPQKSSAAKNSKTGLDDLLVQAGGKELLTQCLENTLPRPSARMNHLFVLAYHTTRFPGHDADTTLHYIVPNHGRHQASDLNCIYKEVVVTETENNDDADSKKQKKSKQSTIIANTRIWLKQVIQSVDGDGETHYQVSYVQLSGRMPCSITGDINLLTFARTGDDIFGRRGAKVLPKQRPAMEEFLNDCQTYGVRNGTVRRVPGTKRRGWSDANEQLAAPVFVMSSKVITADGVFEPDHPECPLIPLAKGSDQQIDQAFRAMGDKNEWRQAIESIVMPCNIPALFIGGGMAGLLRKWCPDSENFLMHVFGGSSHGKTLALSASASCWGRPTNGYLLAGWNSTETGLERRAIGRNDMAMYLDESGTLPNSEEVASRVVYTLANGTEKMRATRDVTERPTQNFNTITLSTGEKQLLSGQRFAGQEVRVLEIQADVAGKLWPTIYEASGAERLTSTLTANYGWACVPMIQGILRRMAKDPKAIENLFHAHTKVLRESNEDKLPQHAIRRIKHFGLILASLSIFLEDVLEWPVDMTNERIDELRSFITKHLVTTDTDQFAQGESEGILQHFRNQLTLNQARFIHPASDIDEIKYGEIFGLIEGDFTNGDVVFVLSNALDKMIKPFDKGRLIAVAVKAGVLIYNDKSKRKTVQKRVGKFRDYFYAFNLGNLEKFLRDEDGAK